MPAGARSRSNNVIGTITDNPLTTGAVSFNSVLLNLLPVISGGHAVVTLDPLRQYGNPEIVVITAHTSSATVATITRGAYGTTARTHPSGTVWIHAPINEDAISILTSSTRPADPYRGEMIFETDSNAFTAFDQTGAWRTVMPLGTWASWTPTVTQGVSVAATINYARYVQMGHTAIITCRLTITGTGTGASFIVIGGSPVNSAATGVITNGAICGSGSVIDNSATLNYKVIVYPQSINSFSMLYTGSTSGNPLGAADFVAALAINDIIQFTVTIETT
jgi:hypothetical protein